VYTETCASTLLHAVKKLLHMCGSSAVSILEQVLWCACTCACTSCVRFQPGCELCPLLVSAGLLQYLCLGPSSGSGHCSLKVWRTVRFAFRFRSVCAAMRGPGVCQSHCHHISVCWHPGLAHGQRCKAKLCSATAAWLC